jgi:predicted secreted Zn-dependent protease
VKYYAISGANASALVLAMSAKGPAVCGLADALACFFSSFTYTYSGGVDYQPGTTGTGLNAGVCSVSSVNLTPAYTIYLPQWTGPSRVPAALVVWWKTVFDHIVWHESQHLAIARSYVQKLEAAIMGGPCDQAGQDKAVAAVQARLNAAQDAFDVQQESWTWPAY